MRLLFHPLAIAATLLLAEGSQAATPRPYYSYFPNTTSSSFPLLTTAPAPTSIPLVYPLPNATATVTLPPLNLDCTINVPKAGLDWWYNTSLTFQPKYLTYELSEPPYPSKPFATAWHISPSPVYTPNVTSLVSAKTTYVATTSFDKSKNRTVTIVVASPLYPPVAPTTTSVIEIGYNTSLPTTSRFSSGDFQGYNQYNTDPGIATTAIAPRQTGGYTATFADPFLRFTQYEVTSSYFTQIAGHLTRTAVTSTYNLSYPRGYGLSSYNFDGVVSATGTVPVDFRGQVPQSSCVAGTWGAVPTVIVVVVEQYGAQAALAVTYSPPHASSASRSGSFKSSPTIAFSQSPLPPSPAGSPAGTADSGTIEGAPGAVHGTMTQTLSVICQGPVCFPRGDNSGGGNLEQTAGGLDVPTSFVIPAPGPTVASHNAGSSGSGTSQQAQVGGVVTTSTPAHTGTAVPIPSSGSGDSGLGDAISSALGPALGAGNGGNQVPLVQSQGGNGAGGSGGSGAGSSGPQHQVVTDMPAATIIVGGQTLTRNSGGFYTNAGQTLAPGGAIITVGGTPVSLAPGGTQAVVGSSTQSISIPTSSSGGLGSYILSGLGSVAPSTSTTASATTHSAAASSRTLSLIEVMCGIFFSLFITLA